MLRAVGLACAMFFLTIGQLLVLYRKDILHLNETTRIGFGLFFIAVGSGLIGITVFGPGW